MEKLVQIDSEPRGIAEGFLIYRLAIRVMIERERRKIQFSDNNNSYVYFSEYPYLLTRDHVIVPCFLKLAIDTLYNIETLLIRVGGLLVPYKVLHGVKLCETCCMLNL